MRKSKPTKAPSVDQLKKELARTRYRSKYVHVLTSTIFTLVVVAAFTILLAVLWLPVLELYGSSMSPTLDEGDIVVTVKTDEFVSGDIVAFYYGNKLLVKRCIALPGDIISVEEDGTVYLNGEPLDEPYVVEKALGECNIEFPYEVPQEQYFVMGDHRAASLDSRSTSVGCVARDQIVGKVVFRVLPFSGFGFIED